MASRISAGELAPGDVLHLHDWRLQVLAVGHGVAITVLTAQFDFPLHFAPDDAVVVDRGVKAWFAAA